MVLLHRSQRNEIIYHKIFGEKVYDLRTAAAGLDPADAERGQVFDTTETALRATLSGLGITIGDLFLIREELASGQLVAPFDLIVSADTGYSLLCRPGGCRDPKLSAFRDWILAEIHNDE
jgi:LysR family glycine cleavage system transcriptional activator